MDESQKTNPNFKQILHTYRSRAKARGLSFLLSEDEVWGLVHLPCHYCGALPSNVSKRPDYPETEGFTYNGIDRVDSLRGYETSNVVPCCGPCNVLKGDRSLREFITHVSTIVHHYLRKLI